jgi:hypothetical protein
MMARPRADLLWEATMNEFQLSLAAGEREYLVSLLQTALKETRIEEHRTRTPSYREYVVQNEDLLEGLLNKLGRPAS